MEKIWIRSPRVGPEVEEEVTEEFVKHQLRNYYSNVEEAMAAASEKMPLTTGFADYWPKEENNAQH